MKRFDQIMAEVFLSEEYNLIKHMSIDEIQNEFYINTRINEINSYEIALACFEVAITKGISFSITNLINAFNVVDPKHKIPLSSTLSDKAIKSINNYKDQTEIYVLLELTQAHHAFDHLHLSNFSPKIWLKPKVVQHIIKKFSTQDS